MRIVPVILCGGAGKRMREAFPGLPKPYLPLVDTENSLLQQTAARALMVAETTDVITVTAAEHCGVTKEQLLQVETGLADGLISEPLRRNTAAAVALALRHIETSYDDSTVIVVLPADHWISNDVSFARQIKNSAKLCMQEVSSLLLFGITPDGPSEEFGYIMAEGKGTGDSTFSVKCFVEKPRGEVAEELIEEGDAYWNSGIFMFSLGTGKALFKKHAVEIWQGVMDYERPDRYAKLPNIPFDRAIVEKAVGVVMQVADFEWLDIGTPQRLQQFFDKIA